MGYPYGLLDTLQLLHGVLPGDGTAETYLQYGFRESPPFSQHTAGVLPVLLQGAQLRPQVRLRLCASHEEELLTELQRLRIGTLVPLEQDLCMLQDAANAQRCSAKHSAPQWGTPEAHGTLTIHTDFFFHTVTKYKYR